MAQIPLDNVLTGRASQVPFLVVENLSVTPVGDRAHPRVRAGELRDERVFRVDCRREMLDEMSEELDSRELSRSFDDRTYSVRLGGIKSFGIAGD